MFINRGPRLLLTFILMFVTLPLLASPAATQDDEESEMELWEAKSYPITITYNSDIWKGRTSTRFNTTERFETSAGSTIFRMQAFTEASITDEQACVTSWLDNLASTEGTANLSRNTDDDLPEGIGGEEGLVTYEQLLEGREAPVLMTQYIACQIFEDDVIVLITIDTRAGIYAEEIEIMNGILSGVAFDL